MSHPVAPCCSAPVAPCACGARCLAAMGTHLRSRGALSEAEVLYRRALTIRQDAGVVETYETVDILQKLGWVCEQQVRPVWCRQGCQQSSWGVPWSTRALLAPRAVCASGAAVGWLWGWQSGVGLASCGLDMRPYVSLCCRKRVSSPSRSTSKGESCWRY